MCRFVTYLGEPILLENVIVKPRDSLIDQSLHAKESSVFTNGDGFGVGWYVPDVDPNPARFLSILPAWNDENLLHLTAKIKASLFFAHVRAASSGGVNQNNCHPFIYNNWMFMHNGGIHDFISIKRSLKNLLDDDIYNWVRGQTDSEHFFALFLQLAKNKDLSSLEVIADVLEDTIETVNSLLKDVGKKGCSYFNVCLSDGKRLIASRYCTDNTIEPESLHYFKGDYFRSKEAFSQGLKSQSKRAVLIASEQLTGFNSGWHLIPKSHLILVENDHTVHLRPMALS